MAKWFGSIGIVFVAGLLSSAAWAGAPGGATVSDLERVLLKQVCDNDASIQCVAMDASGFFTGAECSGTTTCVPDFIPGAEIRALLTIIADDLTPNDTSDLSVPVTVMLEFKVDGQQYVIAESYPAGDKIVDWFNFVNEDVIYNIDLGGGHIMRSDLSDINDRLVQIGQTHFGIASPVVAVIEEGRSSSTSTPVRRAPRKTPELEADESAAGNPLATIARYRVTITYALTP